MRHIILNGRNGVGKSTLIRALLEAIPLPVYGVITKKETDGDGTSSVYIHTYGAKRSYTPENRIGLCGSESHTAFPDAFDRFADSMVFPDDGVIVFDELGFMETDALRFTESVLHTLDSAPLVIAAVRDKQTPFLDAVRSHPRADVYPINEENRDSLRESLLGTLRSLFPDGFDRG